MGHHHNYIKGVGKNRTEAESAAIDEFLAEEGHRHSVRDVSCAIFIKKIPPTKSIEIKTKHHTLIQSVPDMDAPKDKWLEEWEFNLHTHA